MPKLASPPSTVASMFKKTEAPVRPKAPVYVGVSDGTAVSEFLPSSRRVLLQKDVIDGPTGWPVTYRISTSDSSTKRTACYLFVLARWFRSRKNLELYEETLLLARQYALVETPIRAAAKRQKRIEAAPAKKRRQEAKDTITHPLKETVSETKRLT